MSDRRPNKRPDLEEMDQTESPEYVGRAVVALATDPDVMEKTGRILQTRELGREYGFVDIDGGQPARIWPSVPELKAVARKLGIRGYSRMRKAELIAAIEHAEQS